MRSRKKKLVYFKKIPVRVDLEQWQRLDKIRADYHFKSTYEIMQYILGCFLRVADRCQAMMMKKYYRTKSKKCSTIYHRRNDISSM